MLSVSCLSVRIIRETIFYIELFVNAYGLKSRQSLMCSTLHCQ